MNPLDLLNVKFQVSTRGPECGIWRALCDIHAIEGWRRLYRGLSPNVAGNAGGWGFYFLLYNQLERRATVDAPDNLSVSQYRLFSAGASAVMANLTNPIWVLKVRTITAPPNSAYCRLRSGFRAADHGIQADQELAWRLSSSGGVSRISGARGRRMSTNWCSPDQSRTRSFVHTSIFRLTAGLVTDDRLFF